ncbi:MAG: plasmid stabilization system protein ParE [Flavobacteriales bacterium]|jgi:plasmid stabilization system protein ParE
MAQRNIIWTQTAEIQLRGVLEYWVKRNYSKNYSLKLVQLINKRTQQISENPLLFKVTDYPKTRAASLGNFTIFYKTTDSSIVVTGFWDNRQDPQSLLKLIRNKK